MWLTADPAVSWSETDITSDDSSEKGHILYFSKIGVSLIPVSMQGKHAREEKYEGCS